MKRIVLAVASVVAVCGVVGCDANKKENPRALNADRTKVEAVREAMIRNALKSDMALASVHFEAHSARLNGLGEHRLNQFAEILAVDGGTLRLESRAPESDLNNARLESIMEYLAVVGVARERLEVVAGLRGGRGMTADEAIQVRDMNFDPNTQSLTTLIGGGTGGGMGSE